MRPDLLPRSTHSSKAAAETQPFAAAVTRVCQDRMIGLLQRAGRGGKVVRIMDFEPKDMEAVQACLDGIDRNVPVSVEPAAAALLLPDTVYKVADVLALLEWPAERLRLVVERWQPDIEVRTERVRATLPMPPCPALKATSGRESAELWCDVNHSEHQRMRVGVSLGGVTFTKHSQWQGLIAVLEGMAMKKLLILGALGIFLAVHGVVTAMTIYPQLDAFTCDGSHC